MDDGFVVQVHSGYGPLHYDLMIQRGSVLATWQLAIPPAEATAQRPIPARRIGDHRLAYLGYQGPVTGNRGSVAIADRGTCQFVSVEPSQWLVRLDGRTLRGPYCLRQTSQEADQWTFAPAALERPSGEGK
jgi:hypothetical protein